jgi:hypothetical protein
MIHKILVVLAVSTAVLTVIQYFTSERVKRRTAFHRRTGYLAFVVAIALASLSLYVIGTENLHWRPEVTAHSICDGLFLASFFKTCELGIKCARRDRAQYGPYLVPSHARWARVTVFLLILVIVTAVLVITSKPANALPATPSGQGILLL